MTRPIRQLQGEPSPLPAWQTRGYVQPHPADERWRAVWCTAGQVLASRWCRSRVGAEQALRRIARRHMAQLRLLGMLLREGAQRAEAWTPEDETACLMGGGLP